MSQLLKEGEGNRGFFTGRYTMQNYYKNYKVDSITTRLRSDQSTGC